MKKLFIILAFIGFGINAVIISYDYSDFYYILKYENNPLIIILFLIIGILSAFLVDRTNIKIDKWFPEDVSTIKGFINFMKKLIIFIIVLFTLILLIRPDVWGRIMAVILFSLVVVGIGVSAGIDYYASKMKNENEEKNDDGKKE